MIKKRCVNPGSSDAFDECYPVDESESVGDSCVFSVCVFALSLSVPVVTDVHVSPSSVSVLGEVFLSVPDCEFVESQSFSFSRKRQAFLNECQGSMISVPVVTDVHVSPSSVSVLGEVFLSVPDCEFVESQSFSFSRKRQAFLDNVKEA